MSKQYKPHEVAAIVLDHCRKIAEEQGLFKSNTAHEIEGGEEPNNDLAECPESLLAGEVTKPAASKSFGGKKKKTPDQDQDGDIDGADALDMADQDQDGDIDGDDALEESGEEDIEEDGEDEGIEEEGLENVAKPKSFGKSDDLNKARIDGAKSADQKLWARAKRKDSEGAKGVHEETGTKGMSPAGYASRTAKELKDEGVISEGSGDAIRNVARQAHKDKLEESKKIKPNLPKSEEMDKCGQITKTKGVKKLKKFLGLGGTQTSGQTGGTGQGKPPAPPTGGSIADKIGFGKGK